MGQRDAGRDISHVHDHGPGSRGRLRRGVCPRAAVARGSVPRPGNHVIVHLYE